MANGKVVSMCDAERTAVRVLKGPPCDSLEKSSGSSKIW
jgi:hypothetical protein